MGQALILEITDSRGRLLHRARLGSAGLTIGRGYQNDVMLDDPYVDPAHLRIEPTEGGDWVVTDLATRNGTVEQHGGRFVQQSLLQAGQELRIGRTMIRVLAIDHPVPPALPLSAGAGGSIAPVVEPRLTLPIVAIGLVLAGVSQYLSSSEAQGFVELATPGISLLLLTSLWATGWAFTNRIVAHRFRFASHLSWTVLVAAGYSAIAVGLQWVEFLTPTIDWSLLQLLVATAVFATLLFGHFHLVTEWPVSRQWRVSLAVAGVGLLVLGIIGQADWLKDGESAREVGGRVLKPISAGLVPTTSTDRFFRKAAALKDEVDDLAGDEAEVEETPAASETPTVDSSKADGAPVADSAGARTERPAPVDSTAPSRPSKAEPR